MALAGPLLLAGITSGPAASDDRAPRVSLAMPERYNPRDLPVGTKTFRVETDVPRGGIVGIKWSLDGSPVPSDGASVTLSFEVPDTHVLEACVTTRDATLCRRQRLGPPPETVTSRNRFFTARVARKDRPEAAVTGLKREDFALMHRGKPLAGRIASVQENSATGDSGICLAYLFDMSSSTTGPEAATIRTRALIKKQDGSYEFAPDVRARFEAFAGALSAAQDPPIGNPDQDMILGGIFAGGLLTIGPVKASRAASLPGRLEKLLAKEYAKDATGSSPLWTHTALNENVALTAMVLNNTEPCIARKKAIAVDSDLVQFPDQAAVDVNEQTLETIRANYDRNGSSWLLDRMGSEEIVSMPIYAIDRKLRSYTPPEEQKRQKFLREVVQRSGGRVYYLASRSPEEIAGKLREFFAFILKDTSINYDVFWDPEGIDDPNRVTLAAVDPALDVTAHAPPGPDPDERHPGRVLADRRGTFNNAQKLAAAMSVRKSIEEGGGSPIPRATLVAALEAERRLSEPSPPLIREMERTLRAAILEEIKYSGDTAAMRRAVQDLQAIGPLPEEMILEMAGYLPPGITDQVCRFKSAAGSALDLLKAKLCRAG